MKHVLVIISAFLVMSCSASEDNTPLELSSPDKTINVSFNLSETGKPYYMVRKEGKVVIDTSYLGFEFKNTSAFNENFKINNAENNSYDETWQMPWGEQLDVVNHYNELKVELEETSELNRKLTIVFKVYDDGIGFRYEFPEQANLDVLEITEEHT
ncbi:MAG: glycoside hydrolase family 97 protein, partial [Algicola sp.]|nr:glycoside hydrolase family 97 protein [Algicola sp.]